MVLHGGDLLAGGRVPGDDLALHRSGNVALAVGGNRSPFEFGDRAFKLADSDACVHIPNPHPAVSAGGDELPIAGQKVD